MIDKEQVQHIAKLARLSLKEEEIKAYQQNLSQVLDYFSILKEVNTDEVEPMTHSVVLENISRNDTPSKERKEVILRIIESMPTLKDGFLKVKSIFSNR